MRPTDIPSIYTARFVKELNNHIWPAEIQPAGTNHIVPFLLEPVIRRRSEVIRRSPILLCTMLQDCMDG